jgi:hypothetical protein
MSPSPEAARNIFEIVTWLFFLFLLEDAAKAGSRKSGFLLLAQLPVYLLAQLGPVTQKVFWSRVALLLKNSQKIWQLFNKKFFVIHFFTLIFAQKVWKDTANNLECNWISKDKNTLYYLNSQWKHQEDR